MWLATDVWAGRPGRPATSPREQGFQLVGFYSGKNKFFSRNTCTLLCYFASGMLRCEEVAESVHSCPRDPAIQSGPLWDVHWRRMRGWRNDTVHDKCSFASMCCNGRGCIKCEETTRASQKVPLRSRTLLRGSNDEGSTECGPDLIHEHRSESCDDWTHVRPNAPFEDWLQALCNKSIKFHKSFIVFFSIPYVFIACFSIP